MSDNVTFASPVSAPIRERLRHLHRDMLRLHKVLMDDERIQYEKKNGRVQTSGEFLHLVMYDPWFNWLHRISELLVQIDELLENEEASIDQAYQLLSATREMFHAGADDASFGAPYRAALQREPGAVLAHADVQRILFQDS